jgi:hypothetical protein
MSVIRGSRPLVTLNCSASRRASVCLSLQPYHSVHTHNTCTEWRTPERVDQCSSSSRSQQRSDAFEQLRDGVGYTHMAVDTEPLQQGQRGLRRGTGGASWRLLPLLLLALTPAHALHGRSGSAAPAYASTLVSVSQLGAAARVLVCSCPRATRAQRRQGCATALWCAGCCARTWS